MIHNKTGLQQLVSATWNLRKTFESRNQIPQPQRPGAKKNLNIAGNPRHDEL